MIEHIGENIKKYRVRRSLSQQDLANEIGIAVQSLSKVERGLTFPSYENLEKIMKVLDVTPNQLFLAQGVSKALNEDIENSLKEHAEALDYMDVSEDSDMKMRMDHFQALFEDKKEKLDDLFDSLLGYGEFNSQGKKAEFENFFERFSIYVLGEVSHFNAMRIKDEKKSIFYSRVRVGKNKGEHE
ncbi:helix-turn-helix domain-containing protein [Enterococcus casseliflavus]|nr:helix-turn-helix domain-containing protein [Enterococcus casseliflavus]